MPQRLPALKRETKQLPRRLLSNAVHCQGLRFRLRLPQLRTRTGRPVAGRKAILSSRSQSTSFRDCASKSGSLEAIRVPSMSPRRAYHDAPVNEKHCRERMERLSPRMKGYRANNPPFKIWPVILNFSSVLRHVGTLPRTHAFSQTETRACFCALDGPNKRRYLEPTKCSIVVWPNSVWCSTAGRTKSIFQAARRKTLPGRILRDFGAETVDLPRQSERYWRRVRVAVGRDS